MKDKDGLYCSGACGSNDIYVPAAKFACKHGAAVLGESKATAAANIDNGTNGESSPPCRRTVSSILTLRLRSSAHAHDSTDSVTAAAIAASIANFALPAQEEATGC